MVMKRNIKLNAVLMVDQSEVECPECKAAGTLQNSVEMIGEHFLHACMWAFQCDKGHGYYVDVKKLIPEMGFKPPKRESPAQSDGDGQ